MIKTLVALHRTLFGAVDRYRANWLPGLLARVVFAAVRLVYFLNSAMKKIGEGPLGFFTVTDNAYFQILPSVRERYGYDRSQIPFFPYDLIVTWAPAARFCCPS